MSEFDLSPREIEAKLIVHAIEKNDVHKLYLRGVTPDKMLVWGDVLEFVVKYEREYGESPSIDTIALKHNDFPAVVSDGVSVEFLADAVLENHKKKYLREIIENAVDQIDLSSTQTIDFITSKLSELGTGGKTRAVYVDSNPEERLEKFLKKRKQIKEGHHVGLPTGIHKLDETLMGYLDGDLIVVTGPPEVGKCLTGDTLISTDRGFVRIDEITSDMNVISYDESENKFVYQKPELLRQGKKIVYQVTTTYGRRIKLTGKHPLLTRIGWKPLLDIEGNKEIAVPTIKSLNDTHIERYTNELIWDNIESIGELEEEETYDLSLPCHHNFIANDILVHNSFLLLKSALVAYMAGYTVMFISLEMIEEELTLRWHTMAGREYGHTLPNEGLMSGRDIDVDDYRLFLTEKLGNRKEFIIVDDVEGGKCTVPVVEGLIREFQPKLILIDSLPLMCASDGCMAVSWQGILDVAYGLKFLATRTKTVIMASTLSDSNTFDRAIPAQMGELGLGRYLAYAIDLGISIAESRTPKERHLRIFKKRKGKQINDVFEISFDPNRGVIG